MKHNVRWIILVLVLGGALLAACSGGPATPTKVEPARLEDIDGSDFKRVILTEKAAERVGIETAAVRDEQVARTRVVGAQVVSPDTLPVTSGSGAGAGTGLALVRVSLNQSDLDKVDRSQPVRVLSMDDDNGEDADDVAGEALEFGEVEDADEPGDLEGALYYTVSDANLAPGQRVRIELPLLSEGTLKQIIPYAAVLYGLEGEAWVYTNPEPLVFVRHPIVIDYIDGDQAVLSEGVPAGTQVVTVGAAELLGAELGVGK